MSLPRITSVRAILRYPATLSSGDGVSATQSGGAVTFSLNLPGLTTDSAPTSDDYLVSYDNTAGAHRKITIGAIISSGSIAALDSRSFSANHTMTTADAGRTIFLTGTAMGTLTFNTASGYSSTHANSIINTSSRRWSVVINGGQTQWLWPGQDTLVASNSGSSWGYALPGLWTGPPAAPTDNVNTVPVYVHSALGNDNNDGLANGTGAVLKIQTAINLSHFYIAADTVIYCSSGTHTAPDSTSDVALFSGPSQGKPSNTLNIVGDLTGSSTTRQTFILEAPSTYSVINCQDFGTLVVQGFYLKNASGGGVLVNARQLAILDIADCDFGTAGIHFSASNNAQINLLNDAGNEMVIRGSPAAHILASTGANVSLGLATFSITSALSFSVWAEATVGAIIWNGPANYVGTGAASGSIGQRYSSDFNAVMHTNSTLFPGTIDGTTATGGQFG